MRMPGVGAVSEFPTPEAVGANRAACHLPLVFWRWGGGAGIVEDGAVALPLAVAVSLTCFPGLPVSQ